jgi:hypothetical protein
MVHSSIKGGMYGTDTQAVRYRTEQAERLWRSEYGGIIEWCILLLTH